MKALGTTELAVSEKDGRPVLVLSGEYDKAAVFDTIKPVTISRPRGQQIREIVLYPDSLPRTATGKIKRWELQQKAGLL